MTAKTHCVLQTLTQRESAALDYLWTLSRGFQQWPIGPVEVTDVLSYMQCVHTKYSGTVLPM
eukprot:2742272-Amphidinium_carterae.1